MYFEPWKFNFEGETEKSKERKITVVAVDFDDTIAYTHYPIIIKPATLGSSIGIHYAKDEKDEKDVNYLASFLKCIPIVMAILLLLVTADNEFFKLSKGIYA